MNNINSPFNFALSTTYPGHCLSPNTDFELDIIEDFITSEGFEGNADGEDNRDYDCNGGAALLPNAASVRNCQPYNTLCLDEELKVDIISGESALIFVNHQC